MTYTGHCTANNSLAANELGVPGVPGLGQQFVPGTVKGVCVMMHGLQTLPEPVPQVPVDVTGILPEYLATWKNDLVADDWVVVYPSHPEDGFASGVGAQAIYNDVNADTGHGSRYLQTMLWWWDHIVDYIHTNWPGQKIMVCGVSEGGYYVLQIAANRGSTIIGGIAHVPSTIWSNVNPTFTPPVNFSTTTTTGMDAGTTLLNGVTVPLMVSYGTNDIAVGYDTAGTGGTPVSNTDAMITNAVAAGRPITRNSTTDNHELLLADVTTFMSYTTGTLDLLR